jgi:hypothetical protein
MGTVDKIIREYLREKVETIYTNINDGSPREEIMEILDLTEPTLEDKFKDCLAGKPIYYSKPNDLNGMYDLFNKYIKDLAKIAEEHYK